ncbi:hypothetical protein JZ751_010334 [Albula glossodonta]|uniref:Radial spoke head 3 n=1 Tax=Albula glossodonta TaxID=121402 RepID=A0A8T2NWU3_9TELE|nr:hypothetical protein JZ751_010334 [Albula glossodonta]
MQMKKDVRDSTYTFASRPRPLQNRSKYREPTLEPNDGIGNYANIMYDRRVVRGNTYAQNILPATAQKDPIEIQRQQEARRRAIAHKRAKAHFRIKTPEAVEGRQHIDVQTELYLEELSDRVEESSVECQTDAFLDKPPSPLFIPAKTGRDVATQIEEGEVSGLTCTSIASLLPLQLFDFDLEVRPLLETLVGKTVEQSLQEVMEEEELASLRAQQRAYEELHNLELVQVQRLEERERRHREEKPLYQMSSERQMRERDCRKPMWQERRQRGGSLSEQTGRVLHMPTKRPAELPLRGPSPVSLPSSQKVLRREKETAEKMAARAFARQYLMDLLPSVYTTLQDNGYFFDPVERDVETTFLPWLMTQVNSTLEKHYVARAVLDMIIRDVTQRKSHLYQQMEQKSSELNCTD